MLLDVQEEFRAPTKKNELKYENGSSAIHGLKFKLC